MSVSRASRAQRNFLASADDSGPGAGFLDTAGRWQRNGSIARSSSNQISERGIMRAAPAEGPPAVAAFRIARRSRNPVFFFSLVIMRNPEVGILAVTFGQNRIQGALRGPSDSKYVCHRPLRNNFFKPANRVRAFAPSTVPTSPCPLQRECLS